MIATCTKCAQPENPFLGSIRRSCACDGGKRFHAMCHIATPKTEHVCAACGHAVPSPVYARPSVPRMCLYLVAMAVASVRAEHLKRVSAMTISIMARVFWPLMIGASAYIFSQRFWCYTCERNMWDSIAIHGYVLFYATVGVAILDLIFSWLAMAWAFASRVYPPVMYIRK